jgi:hypothetical protein
MPWKLKDLLTRGLGVYNQIVPSSLAICPFMRVNSLCDQLAKEQQKDSQEQLKLRSEIINLYEDLPDKASGSSKLVKLETRLKDLKILDDFKGAHKSIERYERSKQRISDKLHISLVKFDIKSFIDKLFTDELQEVETKLLSTIADFDRRFPGAAKLESNIGKDIEGVNLRLDDLIRRIDSFDTADSSTFAQHEISQIEEELLIQKCELDSVQHGLQEQNQLNQIYFDLMMPGIFSGEVFITMKDALSNYFDQNQKEFTSLEGFKGFVQALSDLGMELIKYAAEFCSKAGSDRLTALESLNIAFKEFYDNPVIKNYASEKYLINLKDLIYWFNNFEDLMVDDT